MLQIEGDRWVRFWQGARLLLAPILAMVLLTIGCGTPPRMVGTRPDGAPRRVQSVATFNVGVGYDALTSQFFMFSDYEAARQSPEASNSFLIALSGCELSGATGSVSGRLDVQARHPAGWEMPVSAPVDFPGSYNWPGELTSTDRDITAELFSAIAASGSTVVASGSLSPHDMISTATSAGTQTTGAAWGDVRLMLAVVARWASVQPDTTWAYGSGGGGSSGGGTGPGPAAATMNPLVTLAVSYDLSTGEATPVGYISGSPPPGRIFLELESAVFEDGSAVPATLGIRTYRAEGTSETSTFDYGVSHRLPSAVLVISPGFSGAPTSSLSLNCLKVSEHNY